MQLLFVSDSIVPILACGRQGYRELKALRDVRKIGLLSVTSGAT
jgi:hypothetical protein